jgi:protein-S-isoprenylcysteine O-methyltransferase Ste14
MAKLNFYGVGPKIGRIALPYLAVSIILTLLFPALFTFGAEAKKPLLIVGAILLISGLALYFATVKKLLDGLKNSKLVTSGTFRYCRNPLYAFLILMVIPGLGLMLNSWIILTTTIPGYIVFKVYIREEYREMESFFGETYREYSKKTPEFFPFCKC